VIRHGAFRAICLMTLLTLSACDMQAVLRPNPVQKIADGMIGKPIQVAIQSFGQPDFGPMSSSSPSGSYLWNNTSYSPPRTVAVQKQVGEQMVGVSPEGNGIAAQPVYQPQYETGYEQQQSLNYLCMIQMTTDAKGIITKTSVSGCRKSAHGY
jgi:hypothetical protein